MCLHSNLSPKIEVGCFYKHKLKLLLSLRTYRSTARTRTRVWTPWFVFQDESFKTLCYQHHEKSVPCSIKIVYLSACAFGKNASNTTQENAVSHRAKSEEHVQPLEKLKECPTEAIWEPL